MFRFVSRSAFAPPIFLFILVFCRVSTPTFADPKQDFLRALRGQPPVSSPTEHAVEPSASVSPSSPASSSEAQPAVYENPRAAVYENLPPIGEIPETLIPPAPPDIPALNVALTPPSAAGQLFVRKGIMGKGETVAERLSAFLLGMNGEAGGDFVRELAANYVEEAETEGVNHDVAFAQMCLETGYLRYGGLVSADMNNFCGLGSTGPGVPGERFATARLGVRAHIQHLKAYASAEPVKQELIDPRAHWVRKGSAPLLQNLAGAWAADRLYADKIGHILARLYEFSGGE